MRLGDKLKQSIADAERKRLDAEERANRAAREKAERERKAMYDALMAVRETIISSIEDGNIPKPIKLNKNIFGYGSGLPIANTQHPAHYIFQEVLFDWAWHEGLSVQVVSNHDGMGMESWWEIKVSPSEEH